MVTAWRRQSQHWRSPVDVLGRGRGLGDCHSPQVGQKQSITVYSSPRSAALCGMGTAQRREPETKGRRVGFSRGRGRACVFSIPSSGIDLLSPPRLEETAASNVSTMPPVSASTSHSARREILFPPFRGTRQSRFFGLCMSASCVPCSARPGLAGWLYARTCCMSDLLWSFPQET